MQLAAANDYKFHFRVPMRLNWRFSFLYRRR